MRSHRILRLLISVLTIGAALAVPAVASAEVEWTYKGNPITTTKTLEVEGSLKTDAGENGGVECNAKGSAKLFPGKAGEMTSFQLTKCNTFGPFKTIFGCEVDSTASTGLPWAVANTGPDGAEVSEAGFLLGLKAGCLIGSEFVVDAPSFLFEPDNPIDIAKFTIGNPWTGETGPEVETNIGPSILVGSFTATTADYGLGVTEGGPWWMENYEPLQSSKQISIDGDLTLSGEYGGIKCSSINIDATIYQYGFGGEIDSIGLSGCETVGVLKEIHGCSLLSMSATAPTDLDVDWFGLIIPEFELSGKIGGGGCAYGSSRDHGFQGELRLNPDDIWSISEFDPEGYIESTTGYVEASSKNGLAMTPAATYGLE